MTSTQPLLALTMGEPAGIGGEIALLAWRALHRGGPCFFLIDDPERIVALAGRIAPDVRVVSIGEPQQARARFADGLPVLPVGVPVTATPGRPESRNAAAVVHAIEMAVGFAKSGAAAGMVTNPIQKSALYDAGFEYPGHTEFLGALAANGREPVMMLVCPELRVVPVTVHQSLRSAITDLKTEMIIAQSLITAEALRADFGCHKPRLAVAGLNPHAGERGAMGDEEHAIIQPAVDALHAAGLDVTGPLPPDTMFTPRARKTYDAAICMYHDQALIPLKALDVDGGVNVTLGLDIVRTSPDHGTALDIAGTARAHPGSLIAALRLAAEIGVRRGGASSL